MFAELCAGPLFYSLLVYVVFLALNLLQFERVILKRHKLSNAFWLKSFLFPEIPRAQLFRNSQFECFSQSNRIQLHNEQICNKCDSQIIICSGHHFRFIVVQLSDWCAKVTFVAHSTLAITIPANRIRCYHLFDGHLFSGNSLTFEL